MKVKHNMTYKKNNIDQNPKNKKQNDLTRNQGRNHHIDILKNP